MSTIQLLHADGWICIPFLYCEWCQGVYYFDDLSSKLVISHVGLSFWALVRRE